MHLYSRTIFGAQIIYIEHIFTIIYIYRERERHTHTHTPTQRGKGEGKEFWHKSTPQTSLKSHSF